MTRASGSAGSQPARARPAQARARAGADHDADEEGEPEDTHQEHRLEPAARLGQVAVPARRRLRRAGRCRRPRARWDGRTSRAGRA
eukprot:6198904-Pyramimonas_sp.AAC.1